MPTLIDAILDAGGDQAEGFHHRFEGGYYIQQFPDELARLVCLLSAFAPFDAYLEIGTAAGGTLRFLTETVQINQVVTIDNGEHAKFSVWQEQNRAHISNLTEFIGNSHSPEVGEFLQGLETTFDLVGIDGDHTPEGVMKDWELIRPFIGPGSLVWFHDINCLDGVKQLWQQLRQVYTPLLETKGLGIGVLRIT